MNGKETTFNAVSDRRGDVQKKKALENLLHREISPCRIRKFAPRKGTSLAVFPAYDSRQV